MVIMSGTATVLQQFVSGLKSRNEDTRAKSAKDLQHYVTTELREVTAEINMQIIKVCHEIITAVYYSIYWMSVVVYEPAVYIVSVVNMNSHWSLVMHNMWRYIDICSLFSEIIKFVFLNLGYKSLDVVVTSFPFLTSWFVCDTGFVPFTVKPRWSHYILWWIKPSHIWAGIQLWCEWEERRNSCHW